MHQFLGLSLKEWVDLLTIFSIIFTGIGYVMHLLNKILDKNVRQPIASFRVQLQKNARISANQIHSISRRLDRIKEKVESHSDRLNIIEKYIGKHIN